MPLIRSLASERRAYTVVVNFLLGEIMPTCSYCDEKKLVYIIIMALFSHQPSFYSKCTKLNICLSCNIKLILDAEYL